MLKKQAESTAKPKNQNKNEDKKQNEDIDRQQRELLCNLMVLFHSNLIQTW